MFGTSEIFDIHVEALTYLSAMIPSPDHCDDKGIVLVAVDCLPDRAMSATLKPEGTGLPFMI
ncbi:hypothetical protein E5345_06575 [Propionibacterium sp. NM47_B9-13]|uniref:Uncharacterized protein n=2 Tax=Cutibacterium modestum TaxID=2559073 RepID=A0AAD1NV90_9ACTN|nr:hypothetical protein BCB70_05605 [Cutibacterium modestum]EFS73504.1 hypothetical protein HMPREF9621_02552 [Cutibacterium modestum HL037PA2]EFS92297.1 hypothetical protein HMPREF9607_01640 [Cutibacterium modestum HL044PA1]EFT14257.1 hypothetical protein HMPREF9622_02746 [Cutibacterium modestum HL037PA3]EGG26491.1 hypothetical protein PA08_1644 [Cutibacterium modestum P08]MCP2375945.1 hypothetical protein [Cutibacterium modestum 28N]MCP2380649.1 hypothetical protein [Cutibacterium modestum 3